MFNFKSQVAEHQPTIKVVGVTPVGAEKVIRITSHWSSPNTELPEVTGEPYTIVLYTSDGVLESRRIPGTWTLAQCKEWNPSSWLAS